MNFSKLVRDSKVDFHIHTTASDGQSTPAEIVIKAKKLGYDMIAITDHDNTNGLEEAKKAAASVGLPVIQGIEIAVKTERGVGLHMLGYNIDPENKSLRSFLETMIENRRLRNSQLFGALQEMGYDISEKDIAVGKNDYIGKPLIAKALVEKGYIVEHTQAYGRDILGSPGCRQIRKIKPYAAEAIEIINEAGGMAVLAHPIQTRGIGRTGTPEFYRNIEAIIVRLKNQGIQGLECYHPDQNREQSGIFVEMAERQGLQITRGSDFHGADFAKADKIGKE